MRTVALLLVLAVPGCQAAFTIETVRVPEVVEPESLHAASVSFIIDCADIPLSPAIRTVTIASESQASDPGVFLTGPGPVAMATDDCRTTLDKMRGALVFNLRATQAARAQVPVALNFTLTYSHAGDRPGQSANASTVVLVAYNLLVAVNVPLTQQRADAGSVITYDLEVANLGNGPATILVEPASVPGWEWGVAEAPTLEPGAQATVALPLTAGRGEQALRIKVTPVAPDGTHGTSVTVTVLAHGRSFMGIPGASVPIAALALALAAARRR